MKVTVTQGLQVSHDGKTFDGGQSVDVPKDRCRAMDSPWLGQ